MCQGKICSKCKSDKPLSEYHTSKRSGKASACKQCESQRIEKKDIYTHVKYVIRNIQIELLSKKTL